MKKFFASLVFAGALLLITGCQETPPRTSDHDMNRQQEKLTAESNRELGLPAISNFYEKKMLKKILELRDDNKLINYAYTFNEMTGKPVFLGKCIGYGIPYATQYTSPLRPARANETFEQGNVTVPQADPNGLFSPPSAEGTWLMLINPKTNEPSVVYIEPRLIVSPFPLTAEH